MDIVETKVFREPWDVDLRLKQFELLGIPFTPVFWVKNRYR